MSKKPISECDDAADKAIAVMTGAIVGEALLPAHVNWAIAATTMGAGVVAIGLAYDVKLTKDEAWKLVKQFFLAAGFCFIALNIGSKIFAMVIESTGIGYMAGVALDCTISGAAAWAIGSCAREYFRRDYLGQGKPSTKELGEIFRQKFRQKKSDLKK